MAPSFLIPFLIAMMLLTGVCNTLLSKYQDLQCVANCDSPDPRQIRRFSQPVLQTAQMFIGEMGCWLVVFAAYLYKRLRSSHESAPLFHTGYAVVSGADLSDDDTEDGTAAQDTAGLNPDNAIVQSLLISADGRKSLNGWKVSLLALPSCCDITGTTLMNAGLLFVAASIYQMTRGALVLFVGVFSVIFLKRRLALYQWSALFIVVLGVMLVGLAGAIGPHPQAQPKPETIIKGPLLLARAVYGDVNMTDEVGSNAALYTIIGVLMIALAQIFTASQFVLEEYILEQYALEPLKVVGWEGVFGFSITVIGMGILHLAFGRTPQGRNGYFDIVEGWREITEYRTIAITSILIMFSIGGFNFFGLSVTRNISATARSTIDTCRTLFIWIVSLALGWESFKWLQIVGFALLVYGTFLFNDIVRPPLKACLRGKKKSPLLLQEEIIGHT